MSGTSRLHRSRRIDGSLFVSGGRRSASEAVSRLDEPCHVIRSRDRNPPDGPDPMGQIEAAVLEDGREEHLRLGLRLFLDRFGVGRFFAPRARSDLSTRLVLPVPFGRQTGGGVVRLGAYGLAVPHQMVMVRHQQGYLRGEQADHADQVEDTTHVDDS